MRDVEAKAEIRAQLDDDKVLAGQDGAPGVHGRLAEVLFRRCHQMVPVRVKRTAPLIHPVIVLDSALVRRYLARSKGWTVAQSASLSRLRWFNNSEGAIDGH